MWYRNKKLRHTENPGYSVPWATCSLSSTKRKKEEKEKKKLRKKEKWIASVILGVAVVAKECIWSLRTSPAEAKSLDKRKFGGRSCKPVPLGSLQESLAAHPDLQRQVFQSPTLSPHHGLAPAPVRKTCQDLQDLLEKPEKGTGLGTCGVHRRVSCEQLRDGRACPI